ncbi:NAD(P)H-binding protein [Bizionia sediminis]|uniref:NAD(P)H-binding protein n=1 Tax=Bizionia sediminis TaxID=1737064 RepID=A0ABW5KUE2_9FLAO
MGKTAIILGATGLTGGLLLQQLLADSRYSKIKLFSRRSCGISNPKIEEHLVDLFNLKTHREQFTAHVVFCCIGTTKAKTPNKETYLKIDYGIPVAAAEIAKENGIKTFIVISALGADIHSKVFYSRTKGRMEAAVLAEQITHTYILQPSLICGKRKEKRLGEDFGKIVMRFLNPFLIGALAKYKSIKPETIAACMVILDNNQYPANRIVSDDIKHIVNQ